MQREIKELDRDARAWLVHNRYENLHIINNYMLALWFVVGTIFFFYNSLTFTGTWLFLLGSIQMLLGPMIRTARKLHLTKLGASVKDTNYSL